MILRFCPQCGSKLQAGFKFCPSCGEKLPSTADLSEAVAFAFPDDADGATRQQNPELPEDQNDAGSAPKPSSALVRPALRQTRRVTTRAKQVEVTPVPITSPDPPVAAQSTQPLLSPQKQQVSPKVKKESVIVSLAAPLTGSPTSPPAVQSPRGIQTPQKRKQASPVVKREKESCSVASASASASPRTPPAAKGKSKRSKLALAEELLQRGEELSDTAGRRWRVELLLENSDMEQVYGVQQVTMGTSSGYRHVLKLAAKDGRIFNEQNFLQRAAKPASVEKWKKLNKRDFLGIPVCEGFGLHAHVYRFLILPHMGQTLQSLLVTRGELLSQKAVLHVACRILNVLEYIHENEYVHADVHAGNIYVNPADSTQVYLAGYCHAFRYRPSGKHVEYREGSRTPHEGTVEFISVDSHKGAGPSRRSDLQTLGYCMLRWLAGPLPWSSVIDSPATVAADKERYTSDVRGLLGHCFGKKKVPGAIQSYLSQVMSLQYTECPDYQQLHGCLHKALQELGGSLNQPLDLQV